MKILTLLLLIFCMPLQAQIQTFKFNSTALKPSIIGTNPQRDIHIYLPKDYQDSEKEYPVIYFLGAFGWSVNYSRYFESIGKNFENQNKDLDAIIVMLEGNTPLRGSFYTNSKAHGNFEDYIIEEVIPWVNSQFRTSDNPQYTGIAGFSMGGTGALRLAAKYPHIFGHVYALSPGIMSKKGMSNSYLTYSSAIQKYKRFIKGLENTKNPKIYMEKEFASFQGMELWRNGAANANAGYLLAYAGAFSGNDTQAFGAHFSDNPALTSKWFEGFGGLIALYSDKSVVSKLSSIYIEVGNNDEYRWITEGVITLKQKTTHLPIQFNIFEGGHSDKAIQRLELSMLPYFLNAFKTEHEKVISK